MQRVQVLVVWLLILPCIAWAGNCSLEEPMFLYAADMGVELLGSKATIFPVSAGQIDRSSFSLAADVFMLVERERMGNVSVQATNEVCWFPKWDADPWADSYDGFMCAPLIRYHDLKEYDCYMESFKAYPPAGNGAHVDTVRTIMSRPDSNFRFTIVFELPSASFDKATYNNTEKSAGIPYVTSYREGILKISYDFADWEWSPAPYGPFLSFYTNLTCTLLPNNPNSQGFAALVDRKFTACLDLLFLASVAVFKCVTVPPGLLEQYDFGIRAGFNWTSADQLYTMYMDFDQAVVVDGVPFVNHVPSDAPIFPLELTEFWVNSYIAGTRMCHDTVYWNTSSVDPFLGIIFNGQDSVTSPDTPASRKSFSTGGKIAIGVVFGLIAVSAVTIVLLVIFVPAVKHFFLPHSKRAETVTRNTQEMRDTKPAPSAAWRPTTAPSTISNI